MEKLCKNCRHWNSGSCSLVFTMSQNEKPEQNGAAVLFRVSDNHGLVIDFRTGPDFGCNRFEPVNG